MAALEEAFRNFVRSQICKVCGSDIRTRVQLIDQCCSKCGSILGILTANTEKGQLRQQVNISVHKFPVKQEWMDAVTRAIEGLFEGSTGVDIVFDLRNYKVGENGYQQKVLIKVTPRQSLVKSASFQ